MRGLCAVLLLWAGAAAAQPALLQAPEPPDPALREALIRAVGESESFEDRYAAEVWLLDMSRRLQKLMPDPDERLEFLRMVHAEAARAQVQPELVLSVIEIESRFDRYAISSAGALGMMQVMPFWLKEIGRPEDNLFNTATNLRYGCTILKFYLDRENGNLVNALARYNGSYGRPHYPAKVLKALSTRWFRG